MSYANDERRGLVRQGRQSRQSLRLFPGQPLVSVGQLVPVLKDVACRQTIKLEKGTQLPAYTRDD